MGSLLEELKRRKVFRIAGVYTVVGWVLAQVAAFAVETFAAPQWVQQMFVVFLILGFPLAIILAWAYEVTPEGIKSDSQAATSARVPSPQGQGLIYATFALVLLVAGFQITDRFLSSASQEAEPVVNADSTAAVEGTVSSSIILSRPLRRNNLFGYRTLIDLSADGSKLYYFDYTTGVENVVHDLRTQNSRVVAQGGRSGPGFDSPDGQHLLTLAPGRGEVVSMGGQFEKRIESANYAYNWFSNEELIYLRPNGNVEVFSLVDESIRKLGEVEASAGFGAGVHRIPGKQAILYSEAANAGSEVLNQRDIKLFDALSNTSATIIVNGYYPQFVESGHIVFLRAGSLWAVPFDPESMAIIGQQIEVIENVDSMPLLGVGAYAVSDFGRLVYLPGVEYFPDQSRLMWTDFNGVSQELLLPVGSYTEPKISFDGQFLAVASRQPDGKSDIWVYDFSQESFNRKTFFGNATRPLFNGDSSQLIYQISDAGYGELWQSNMDGTGQPERILAGPAKPEFYSATDDKILYLGGSERDPRLRALSFIDGGWISESLIDSDYDIYKAQVSPDGRWVTYMGAETGLPEIYVRPYPDMENGKWQISNSAESVGIEPVWSESGNQLFFLQFDGTLMRSRINSENGFTHSNPEAVLSIPITPPGTPIANYAISNDGERVLHFKDYLSDDELRFPGHTVLTQVDNWFEELKRLAPPDRQ